MTHDCALGLTPEQHTPMTEPEDLQAFDGGYCPLCLHDFMGTHVEGEVEVCIECGHAFKKVDNQILIISEEEK